MSTKKHQSEAGGNRLFETGIDRRTLLRGAAGAVVAGIVPRAYAQENGDLPLGNVLPWRRPEGGMDTLDTKQYISNMEIISFLPGHSTAGGEPLMTMWAKGAQRLLPSGHGWVDVSDPRKPVYVDAGSSGGHTVSGLHTVSYNTQLKKWLSLVSAAEPATIPNPQHPEGNRDQEYNARALNYKGLRGIRVFDITDPTKPNLLSEFSTGETGSGTHMNYYDGGRYAYLDAGYSDQFRMENVSRPHGNGLMIVDMTDPASPKEVARWHVPGQLFGEEDAYKKYWFAGDGNAWTCSHGAPVTPVRVEDGGRYGYGGFGAFGMIVFDFSDIRNPKMVGQAMWDYETTGGIPYHTVYPLIADRAHPNLANIVVGVPETIYPDCREPYKAPQLVDVSDPANPRVIGVFPRPKPPEDAPYADFCLSRGRFGTHNSPSWVAPGTQRPDLIAMSWFNAGIRLFDISDPRQPRQVAWFLPPRGGKLDDYRSWYRGDSETVFIEWDRNIIWLGTHAGCYALSSPALGKPILEPRKIDHWTRPFLNRGWDT